MIYLDANASETLRPEAAEAVTRGLRLAGNPASVHAAGRAARAALEDARARIAALLGAAPEGVVFCSGATEANALMLKGFPDRRLIIGATEHDAVRACAKGAEVIPVRPDGQIALDALEQALGRGGPAVVALMLANNETGVLHPIAQAAGLARAHGALLHVDAAQAMGRVGIDLAALGAASLALSGHKLGGPAGAGALILAPGVQPASLIEGGGQERGRRGGTPPLPAILGMAAAADAACAAMAATTARHASLTAAIAQAARAAGAVLIGTEDCGAASGAAPRLANTLCLALPGVRAEAQLIALDLEGICVSAGAACSAGKVARSHVIEAMGRPDLAGCALRISLPWNASDADVTAFIGAYQRLAARVLRGGA